MQLNILLEIVGQICQGDFFMYVLGRAILKKWKAVLRFFLSLLKGDCKVTC